MANKNAFEMKGPFATGGAEYNSAFGEQDTPSPQGAASQGALDTPSEDGVSSGKDLLLGGGTPAAVDDYYGIWYKGSKSEKRAQSDEMDKALAPMGTSVMVRAGELIQESMKSGDTEALAVAAKFGWEPIDTAFKDSEGEVKKKSKWDRNAMGGFLTEMGFRILASNRADFGGALGEAGMGMRAEKKADTRQAAADKMAKTEADRKARRDEQTMDISSKKEARDQATFDADKAAGRLGKTGDKSNYETQRDDWMKWELGDDPTKAEQKKAYRNFRTYFSRSDWKPAQREKAILDTIEARDSARRAPGYKEWIKKTDQEKRDTIIAEMSAMNSGQDSGPSLDYNADATFN